MISALTTCVDKLEIKENTCAAMIEEETFARLNASLIEEAAYMQPMNEIVVSHY